jgi:glycosidase
MPGSATTRQHFTQQSFHFRSHANTAHPISARMRRCFLLAVFAARILAAAPPTTPMPSPTQIQFGKKDTLEVTFSAPGIDRPGSALFVALDSVPIGGSAQVPFGQGTEGSAVFLPFRADRIYAAQISDSALGVVWREWKQARWSDRMDVKPEFTAHVEAGKLSISIRLAALERPLPKILRVTVWAKNMRANNGWGEMIADTQLSIRAGLNDRTIDRFFAVDLESKTIAIESRLGAHKRRARIYQLLPRLFSNTNETRKPNGTLAENGVGKFADINATALAAIKGMGFTHVWLTGILNQATSTDYSAVGLPADDPDLLKGLAGSPYAIRDYFDVSPDYAIEPANRLAEFRALLARTHDAGLRVIIDCVPNHVARSYHSTLRPHLTFGAHDDHTRFFCPRNNFYWLQTDSPGGGPPLRLPTVDNQGRPFSPTCRVLGRGDGLFEGELHRGRVTGNNVVSWRPSLNDWYETVKLNYGYDFTTGFRQYPHASAPERAIPNTWLKMDAVLAYWQSLGVDGFRCDMAHMVPPEFWSWALDRARQRVPGTFFAAEAYDNDPMKVGTGNVMIDLLSAGFNAVYDDPSYKVLKATYEAQHWANDLDAAFASADREYIFQNSLRYAENHDEVRLAGAGHWGGIGAAVGRAVSAILYGAARGPVLVYSGQEVGEPANGSEGFGNDDARSTIFDYWSMPELAKWVNHHRYDGARLSPEQRNLQSFYSRLVLLCGEPAFRDGEYFGLNYAQRDNPHFGRLTGEDASGHWLFAFLRCDLVSRQRFLIVANLHRDQTLREVRVRIPHEALEFAGIAPGTQFTLTERLIADCPVPQNPPADVGNLTIGDIPPLTPFYFELTTEAS